MHDAVMAALVEHIEQAPQWDAPPELFMVYVLGRQVTLSPMPLPPGAWCAFESPAMALESLADALSGQHGALMVPPGPNGSLHAVAFVHEAFWVDVDTSDPHEARRVQALVDRGRLRDHPAAKDIRFAVAVDRDGVTYNARHVRGAIGTERDVQLPGGGADAQASGIAIEALDRLVETFTGAKPQQRPASWLVPPAEMNLTSQPRERNQSTDDRQPQAA